MEEEALRLVVAIYDEERSALVRKDFLIPKEDLERHPYDAHKIVIRTLERMSEKVALRYFDELGKPKSTNSGENQMYKIAKPDPQQQEGYLEAIEWLVSGHANLGSGRTFLLARAFVNIAVKNPGRAIPIFDHCPTLRCTMDIMGPEVRLAAKRLYPLGNFTFTQRSVKFDGYSERN